jgi:hypothetical protein
MMLFGEYGALSFDDLKKGLTNSNFLKSGTTNGFGFLEKKCSLTEYLQQRLPGCKRNTLAEAKGAFIFLWKLRRECERSIAG